MRILLSRESIYAACFTFFNACLPLLVNLYCFITVGLPLSFNQSLSFYGLLLLFICFASHAPFIFMRICFYYLRTGSIAIYGCVVEKIDSKYLIITHYYLVGKLKENLAPLPSELFSPHILPP